MKFYRITLKTLVTDEISPIEFSPKTKEAYALSDSILYLRAMLIVLFSPMRQKSHQWYRSTF